MIRVLIVDDSAVARLALRRELEKAPDIEVVGAAADPYVAREMIARFDPQVITLDIQMPRMDGLTFLGKLMEHHPLPTIVVSSKTPRDGALALEALALGAFDVLCKPGAEDSVSKLGRELVETIRAAATRGSGAPSLPHTTAGTPLPERFDEEKREEMVWALGASTGGTVALERIVRHLPSDVPGLLIVQHLPGSFTAAFSERLDAASRLEVREARDGDEVRPGRALVAPGDRHMVLRREQRRYLVRVKDGPLVNHHRPSVDVLFRSVAKVAGDRSVGVLLTGMGRDGAKGLLAIRQAGGRTIAQNKSSSVVYGMPKAAIELGAAMEVVSLEHIPHRLLDAATKRVAGRSR